MTQSSNSAEVNQQYLENAYKEEREHLSWVIQTMQERAEHLESRMPARAADHRTADAIQAVLESSRATIDSALEQPYFGRIDFLTLDPPPDSENPTAIYIGASHIPETNVYNWTVPVARLWYTNESRYTAPRGVIRVRVDLKRFLRIREQHLIELNDTYRRALPASQPSGAGGPNPALTAALSGSGSTDGQLQVIIETIEPDQYENISNVTDQVLVVQGSPGSGKSEIGLHRIAFLLSPFNDLPDRQRPTPNTTLFIGPSASFLEYVSDLLPRLGVQENVRQVTFYAWLTNHHSTRLNIKSGIWNNLLISGQVTKFNLQAETFKGSMAMVDILDRHVRDLLRHARNAVRRLPPLTIVIDGQTSVTLDGNDVHAALNDALSGAESDPRLNVRRQLFVRRVAGLARSMAAQLRPPQGQAVGRRRIETDHVSPWLEGFWSEIDFRQEYVALLSDTERLLRLSRGTVNEADANALKDSVQRSLQAGFEDSNVGALTYLDHLLNGTISRIYRHIVVDEAQDISPIEFMLLKLSSANNWFTVLGDTSQRLTPYRGINRWRDIQRVVGRSTMKVQHARTSYRSNQHITRFNNRILRLFDANIEAPIPFGRDGHRAEYHRHTSNNGMYEGVTLEITRIRSLEGLTNANIAILTRDKANLTRFQQFCSEHGFNKVTLFGQETLAHDDQTLRTTLARIPDVKGLEFDAVIVLGVNESFAATTFNQKLLYMATTRAKHYLAIHWSGQASPILRALYSGGVTYFDHTPARVSR